MIIILDIPKADVGRFDVINNFHERYPGQVVRYLNQCDLSLMERGETLYLLAHGGDGKVAEMTPTKLAQELIAKGLKTGTRIEICACFSGLATGALTDPFNVELADAVKAESDGRVVVLTIGATGPGVVQENGAYRAKDPELNNALAIEAYKKIIDGGSEEIEKAKKVITEGLERGDRLEVIARQVADLTKKTFKKLYDHNMNVIKSLEGSRTSSSLIKYLSAMDPLWAKDVKVLDAIREREKEEWDPMSPKFKGPPSYIA